jgi:hypothetical protein
MLTLHLIVLIVMSCVFRFYLFTLVLRTCSLLFVLLATVHLHLLFGWSIIVTISIIIVCGTLISTYRSILSWSSFMIYCHYFDHHCYQVCWFHLSCILIWFYQHKQQNDTIDWFNCCNIARWYFSFLFVYVHYCCVGCHCSLTNSVDLLALLRSSCCSYRLYVISTHRFYHGHHLLYVLIVMSLCFSSCTCSLLLCCLPLFNCVCCLVVLFVIITTILFLSFKCHINFIIVFEHQ